MMDLQEDSETITDTQDIRSLMNEPVRPYEKPETAQVNKDDFALDSFDAAPGPQPAPENVGDKPGEKTDAEKNTTTEKETVTNPDGSKITTERTTITQSKSDAVKRLFNADTALLMFDILAKRAGRMAMPDRPDYFRMTIEDTEDFKTLLQHTAEEESWETIPAKYLLIAMGVMWLFGKAYMWNKPHLWPKEHEYKRAPGSLTREKTKGDKNDAEPDIEKQGRLAYERERARVETENRMVDIQVQNQQLMEMNQRLLKLLENRGETPDDGYVPFQEIKPGDAKLRYFEGIDLETISFSDGGALIDKTKAGEDGYDENGKKNGRPTNEHIELREAWEKYHESKAAR